MELDTEEGTTDVADTFIAAVVRIDEQLFPAFREGRGIHGISMVLRSDVTLSRNHTGAGNIVAAVTELHLDGMRTNSSSEELVSQTDTKYRCPSLLDHFGNVVHRGGDCGWVTWTVGNEETIVVLRGQSWKIVVPGYNQDFDTAR
jgi:hypothetical protein